MNYLLSPHSVAKRLAALLLTLSALTPLVAAQDSNGVLSFVDLDPTPDELFEDCLAAAPDMEGVLECTTNVELINVEEFEDCAGAATCERYAYSVPLFPEKLGQLVASTYDELWQRHIDDIYDYSYDAWKKSACAIKKFPEVAADVMMYGLGDASLRYWSEVFVASSYYLPASLWWQTPFPGAIDFGSNSSDRIITPVFSLVPNPDQYLDLGAQADDSLDSAEGQDRGIYYFQPPAFPANPVSFREDELQATLPGLPAFEKLKERLGPVSALEYSQFGHASFFESHGKRRVVDIFVVWVKECVPTTETSPLAVFIVPLLPKVQARVTTSAEGYSLSKVGKQSWFPDPDSAFEPNSLEDAADRTLNNPNYATDLSSYSPLDPKRSLLGQTFMQLRIPLATDFNIPQEVVDDAKSGGEDDSGGGGGLSFPSGGGVSIGGAGGGGTGEEERASLADVLNCPPVTVGPEGATPYPILAIESEQVYRPLGHYNQSIQYLFRDTADHLYSDEVRSSLDEFVSYFELPESTDPGSWKLSSKGKGRGDSKSGGAPVGGSFLGANFGGPGSNGVLCEGDEGSEVATLDRLLARAGSSGSGSSNTNTNASPSGSPRGGGGGGGNEFTEDTKEKLIEFQEKKGLTPDGMTGPETWAALHAAGADRQDPAGYQSPVQGTGAWKGGFQGGQGSGQGGGNQDGEQAPSPPEDEGGEDGSGEGSSRPDIHTLLAERSKTFFQATATGPLLAQVGGESQVGEPGQAESGGQESGGLEGGDGGVGQPPPPDSADLALEVLDNPNILLWDGSPIILGDGTVLKNEDGEDVALTDGSDPLSNVIAAAEGEPSKRSDFNGVPSGHTWLSPYMLEGLLEVAEYHYVEVIAIAGGVHPPNSRHYEGAAFAISAINGIQVRDMPIEIGFSDPAEVDEGGGLLSAFLDQGDTFLDSLSGGAPNLFDYAGGQGSGDATGEGSDAAEGSGEGGYDANANVTTTNMISDGTLNLPTSINGESLDEIFKPDEEDGGLLGGFKKALGLINDMIPVPTPLDITEMTLDKLMKSDDISDSFDQDSPNTLLQVVALCELAFATDVYSPFNDETRETVECNWPTAEEVESGEAEEPGEE